MATPTRLAYFSTMSIPSTINVVNIQKNRMGFPTTSAFSTISLDCISFKLESISLQNYLGFFRIFQTPLCHRIAMRFRTIFDIIKVALAAIHTPFSSNNHGIFPAYCTQSRRQPSFLTTFANQHLSPKWLIHSTTEIYTYRI